MQIPKSTLFFKKIINNVGQISSLQHFNTLSNVWEVCFVFRNRIYAHKPHTTILIKIKQFDKKSSNLLQLTKNLL